MDESLRIKITASCECRDAVVASICDDTDDILCAIRSGTVPSTNHSNRFDSNVVDVADLEGHSDGTTYLMVAAAVGNVDAVLWLMQQRGLNVNARRASCGHTALTYAVQSGSAGVVRALLRTPSIDTTTKAHGLAALELAIFTEQHDIFELIMKVEGSPQDGKNSTTSNANAPVATRAPSHRLRPVAAAVAELLRDEADRNHASLDPVRIEAALRDLGYDPLEYNFEELVMCMEACHDSVVFSMADREARGRACTSMGVYPLPLPGRDSAPDVPRLFAEDLRLRCATRGGAEVPRSLLEHSQRVPGAATTPTHPIADFIRFPVVCFLRNDNKVLHMVHHRAHLRLTCGVYDFERGELTSYDVNDDFVIDLVSQSRSSLLNPAELVALAIEISAPRLLRAFGTGGVVPNVEDYVAALGPIREEYVAHALCPAVRVAANAALWNPITCYALMGSNNRLFELLYAAECGLSRAYQVQVLVASCFHGHVTFTKQVLQRNIEVGDDLLNDVDEKTGWTPLTAAVQGNQPQQVADLVRLGADVNTKQRDACTPIFLACAGSNLVVATVLLHAKCDVNVETFVGATPLTESIRVRNMALMSALLKAGARPTVCTLTGVTPLLAASWVLPEAVPLLQHHNAEAYAFPTSDGEEAFPAIRLVHEIADVLACVRSHIDPSVLRCPSFLCSRDPLEYYADPTPSVSTAHVEYLSQRIRDAQEILMSVCHGDLFLHVATCTPLLQSWLHTLQYLRTSLVARPFYTRNTEMFVDEVIALVDASVYHARRLTWLQTFSENDKNLAFLRQTVPLAPSAWLLVDTDDVEDGPRDPLPPLPVGDVVEHLRKYTEYSLWVGWRAQALQDALDPSSSGWCLPCDYIRFCALLGPDPKRTVDDFCIFAEKNAWVSLCTSYRATAALGSHRRGTYMVAFDVDAATGLLKDHRPFRVHYTTVLKDVNVHHVDYKEGEK
eukprot:PhM_4_TR17055/c1_g1_i1/m.90397